MLFATTWMDLEGIMLSKISQILILYDQSDTIQSHLYVESKNTKKVKLIETDKERGCQGLRVGDIGRGWRKGTTFQL